MASESAWTPVKTLDELARGCCDECHFTLLDDPEAISLTQRVARMGPVTICDIVVGSDMSVDCGEVCGSYRVVLLQSGHIECVHRGVPVSAGPGTAAVYSPEGTATVRWASGSKMLCLKIDRSAVDDALSAALGREVTSKPEFKPIMRTDAASTRSWISMALLLADQLFRPDSILNKPMAGLPFVDSLVRGFLLATEHSHRDALAADEHPVAPRAIRTAVDIIEAEAHLPLRLYSIAARSHVSVRSLQQGFRRHLGTSPMAYLRDVRLHRAQKCLLESDPTTVTVASVAYSLGFTNLGRFAAAYTARYGEPPAKTLRRGT